MQVDLRRRRNGQRPAQIQRNDLVKLSTRSWWRVVSAEGATLYLERVSEDLFGDLGEKREALLEEVRASTSRWRKVLS